MNLPLWPAVSVFRVAALGYAAFSIFHASDHYARPGVGWSALATMAGWTLVAVVYARRPARRPALRLFLGADVAIAVGLVLAAATNPRTSYKLAQALERSTAACQRR